MGVFEKECGYAFKPGLTKDTLVARLTLDPVFAVQRPFVCYLFISVMNLLAYLVLAFMGFHRMEE